MNNPPAVKEGDRVRVVLEGVVQYVEDDGDFDLGEGYSNWIVPSDAHVVSVEVLKRPVKVGDKIEGEDDYEALPFGAVVADGSEVYIRTRDGFVDEGGDKYGPRDLSTPRTLVYLRKVAA